MDMPPSRYKVVEKGRRLVVVDTLTGDAVRPAPIAREPDRPARMAPAPRVPVSSGPLPGAEAAARRRGPVAAGTTIETQRWYDNKAPRTVVLPENSQAGMLVAAIAIGTTALVLLVAFGFPVLIVGAVLLANVHKPIRAAVTGWLDGLDEAQALSSTG